MLPKFRRHPDTGEYSITVNGKTWWFDPEHSPGDDQKMKDFEEDLVERYIDSRWGE